MVAKTESRICPVCKGHYLADPLRLKHGRETTCSRKCSYEHRAALLSKQEEYRCGVCNAPFSRSPSQVALVHGVPTCSRDCRYEASKLGLIGRIVTRPYSYPPESKQRMLEASRRPKGKRIFHWLTCAFCGHDFDDPSDGRARKSGYAYCSLSCCNAHRVRENNPSWQGGHPSYYGSNWRCIRRQVWDRDDHSCRRCGFNGDRNPDVHHIIPIRLFSVPEEANTLDNLVSLCHICHTTVEKSGIDFVLLHMISVDRFLRDP